MPTTPLVPGDPQQLGEYWLAGRLGAGGQGVVYEAYDPTGRRVAIKVLRADFSGRSALRERFAKELAAARRVAAFCTARVITAELDGTQPYIVSEYVEGPSLREAVKLLGGYGPDQLYRLATGIATALTVIHRAGVVHRDLTPNNVLLSQDGLRVIDFGIARIQDVTASTAGRPVGTPAFMAPERLSGENGEAAVDMWAWGAVLLFAATGRPPFRGDNPAAIAHRVLSGEPDFSVLKEPLRALVVAAMAKDPRDRPDARTVLLALVGGPGGPGDPLAEGSLMSRGFHRPPGQSEPSLVERAERVYSRLLPADQPVVPRILLRLVLPGETADSALRKANTRDVLDGTIPRPTVERVLSGFAREELLVHDGRTIALASAALLRAWPRMREWIDTDREGLRVHSLLDEAVKLWEANGRKPGDLYRGTALEKASRWAETGHLLTLNLLERDFLKASAALARIQARRRNRVVGAIAGLLSVALLAGGIAVIQNTRRRDVAAAGQALDQAEARRTTDPVTAMLLSVAAWELSPSAQARAALHSSLTRRERNVLQEPSATGNAQHDLSGDGGTLVVVDRGRATLWDVTARRVVKVIGGVTGRVRTIALSPDGKRLAVAGERDIRLWDVRTGRRLDAFGGPAHRLRFSPGRNLLFAFTLDGRSQIWDLTALVPIMDEPLDPLDVEFSPDEALAALTFTDGHYELWDRQRGRFLRRPGDLVAFGPGGGTLAVSQDGDIRIWDLVAERWRGKRMGGDRTERLSLSPEGGYLAAYDGKDIVLWSPDHEEILSYPAGPVEGDLKFGPGNRTLGYLGPSGAVTVLDIADLTRPGPFATGVEAGAFAPDARLVAVRRRGIELWDVKSRTRVAALGGPASPPVALAFGADGRTLAVATSYPARVALWDVATARRKRTLTVRGAEEIDGLAFHDDGRTLLISPLSPQDGRMNAQLWDSERGRRTGDLGHVGGWTMAFRPGGDTVAINGLDSAVVRISPRKITSKPFGAAPDGVRALGFSPDGKIVVTGYAEEGVHLWDAAGLRRIARLPLVRGEFEEINVAAFSPDGRTLAVAGRSGAIWLWDLDGPTPLGWPSSRHAGHVLALAFSPDGDTLHSLGQDGTLREHPLDPGHLVAAVCARAAGTLSQHDWEALIPGAPYREIC